MHPLANNLTPPQADLIDAVRFPHIAAIPYIVDQENPHARQR
jgi:hypothetical protein